MRNGNGVGIELESFLQKKIPAYFAIFFDFLPAAIAVRSSNGPSCCCCCCCWGRGDIFVGPPNDLVAQSHSNSINISLKDRKNFPNWSLSMTRQFQENCQKRFKLQI